MIELFPSLLALSGGGGGQSGPGGLFMQFFPLVLVFGIMYFLVIRPQQKKQKEHEAFLNALKSGDRVITQGGVLGTVKEVAENIITLEIGDRNKIKVMRSHILARQGESISPPS